MKRAARRIPVGACPCSLRRVATQGVPIRHPGGSLFCSARVGFPFTGYLIPPLILKNRTECRQGAGTDEQAAEPCRPPDQRPAVQQGAAEEHGALRRRAVRLGAGAPRRTLSSAVTAVSRRGSADSPAHPTLRARRLSPRPHQHWVLSDLKVLPRKNGMKGYLGVLILRVRFHLRHSFQPCTAVSHLKGV